jgi:hypothetical protein
MSDGHGSVERPRRRSSPLSEYTSRGGRPFLRAFRVQGSGFRSGIELELELELEAPKLSISISILNPEP